VVVAGGGGWCVNLFQCLALDKLNNIRLIVSQILGDNQGLVFISDSYCEGLVFISDSNCLLKFKHISFLLS
jgi:hypothetical protein